MSFSLQNAQSSRSSASVRTHPVGLFGWVIESTFRPRGRRVQSARRRARDCSLPLPPPALISPHIHTELAVSPSSLPRPQAVVSPWCSP